MKVGADSGMAFSPYWTAPSGAQQVDMGAAALAISNISFASDVSVPQGGSWIKNNEGTPGASPGVSIMTNTIPMTNPDLGTRWCARYVCTWHPDALSTLGSDASIWWGGGGTSLAGSLFNVIETSSHTFKLLVGDTTATPWIGATGTYVAVAGHDYLLTLEGVFVSGGVLLPTVHWCLRIWDITAGLTYTLKDTLHAYAPAPAGRNFYGTQAMAYTAGTGRIHRMAHNWGAIEDADNLGAIRVAWYTPNLIGEDNGMTGSGVNPTAWLEVPADTTSYLQNNGSLTEKATSKVTLGTGATAPSGVGDTVLATNVISSLYGTTSKGGSLAIYAMISDGTTELIKAQGFTDTGGAFNNGEALGANGFFSTNPGGTAWAYSDISNPLRIGIESVRVGTGSVTRATSIQAMVGWVKSGETLAATPGPDWAMEPMFRTKSQVAVQQPPSFQGQPSRIALLTATTPAPTLPMQVQTMIY